MYGVLQFSVKLNGVIRVMDNWGHSWGDTIGDYSEFHWILISFEPMNFTSYGGCSYLRGITIQ